MAIFYNEGEQKKRPGVYQRHSNIGNVATPSAQDGFCAIPIHAEWGPMGKVLRNKSITDLNKNYGSGEYSSTHTVPAAASMFEGGASTVYTYRMGTGGKKASKEITSGLTATAKYVGTKPISVAVQNKLGDDSKKQLLVYAGTTLVETFDFAADNKAEGANLIAAASGSEYIDITGTATNVDVLAAASGELTGGENPSVTNANYSDAFAAFEPYYYNTIALDVDDDENASKSLLLQSYLDGAWKNGKQGIAVVGEKTTVDFNTRCKHAKAFNDAKVVYLGGGPMVGNVNKDGVMAICYTAGVIACTPSNQGITHTVYAGATDLCESLTNAQLEDAIDAGMLMLTMSPDGSIWYDSAITTLTAPEVGTQDDGWKKIRRTKVRMEMIHRLDLALEPKVGRVSADTDGIADIVQTGQRVLTEMENERKLQRGASFTEDPNRPFTSDSGWFIVRADDIDSLEKIYEHYQFRYSQAA